MSSSTPSSSSISTTRLTHQRCSPSDPTKTGRTLTDAEIDAIAEEVETADYEFEVLKTRRRGRPAMGQGPLRWSLCVSIQS